MRTPRNFAPVIAHIAACFVLCFVTAQAQTFQVIHNFAGGNDGAVPLSGLIIDQVGNLYGTASGGGVFNGCDGGCGVAYRMKRSGEGWALTPLYVFQGGWQGGLDGAKPQARMVFAPNGGLYGTTAYGGGNLNCGHFTCGTAFKLTPPPTACRQALCAWDETVVYRFVGPPNAGIPDGGPLAIDQHGNLYGVAAYGSTGFGVVYQLANNGGNWSENDIAGPGESTSGVVFDSAGNLYGSNSGFGYGGVYQLVPNGSSWTLNQIFAVVDISDDGFQTYGGVILDNAGNLYASTIEYGPGNGGAVLQLSAGTWNVNALYGFTGDTGPEESLSMDSAGNLYGTTYADGAYNLGNVFKLTPSAGGWTYTDLYDFTGGSDGRFPVSNVVIDAQGNLFGTASLGGTDNYGVVWEITP